MMIEFNEESDLLREEPSSDHRRPLSTAISMSKEELEQVLTYLVNELWRADIHN